MEHQAYFDYLEFDLVDVRALQPIEMIAEKVRAASQRAIALLTDHLDYCLNEVEHSEYGRSPDTA